MGGGGSILAILCHRFLFLLFALPLLWGCEKEVPGLDVPEQNTLSITDRNEPSQAEIEDLRATVDSIIAFKAQVDRWRSGLELNRSIDAEQAAELVETSINFYISKPGQAYENYISVIDSVIVPTSASTWTGTQVAALFNAMKSRLVHHFNQVSSTDKAYQIIDMGPPVADGSNSKVYFFTTLGVGQTETPSQPTVQDIRWAEQLPSPPAPPGQFGFTVTECGGDAAEEIGRSVNASLGLFLENLAPTPINPGNPNTDPSTKIISPVNYVQTDFLGSNQPLGNAPPALFLVSTFYQTPSFAFPFLVNSTSGGNVFPSYAVRGQFKIHADFSFGPDLPDENCFSFSKYGTYAISNKEVGEFYRSEVNQLLSQQNDGPFPSFFGRQLISTYVQPLATTGDTGLGIPAYRQEHVTWHFYASAVRIVISGPEELCCPQSL